MLRMEAVRALVLEQRRPGQHLHARGEGVPQASDDDLWIGVGVESEQAEPGWRETVASARVAENPVLRNNGIPFALDRGGGRRR